MEEQNTTHLKVDTNNAGVPVLEERVDLLEKRIEEIIKIQKQLQEVIQLLYGQQRRREREQPHC